LLDQGSRRHSLGESETRGLPMQKLLRVLLSMVITTIGLFLFTGLAAAEVKFLKGQTCYLPCPTSFMSGGYSFNIKATIFIHNTDPNNSINIVRMDFYNTSGKLIAKYLPQPLKLDALAATRINVKEPLDGEEGIAAHFVIQWQSEAKVVEPLIDGLFTGSSGTHGYSFTFRPRIMQEVAN